MDQPKRTDLHKKQEALIAYLRSLGRVAVAFSGGVDSTYLLYAAREALGDQVIAITGEVDSFPKRERQEAADLCRQLGVKQIPVRVDQLAVAAFKANTPERCYHCKKALFTAFLEAAGEACLVEGSNLDDMGDYRPGMKAVEELGVLSPLREAGLTKAEIRDLSREAQLPTWDKPSFACLATRIPCGEEITREKLAVIEQAEQFLFDRGFKQFRVRFHGPIARIEIDRDQFQKLLDPAVADQVSRHFKDLGFRYVTLDLGGYQTGSTNQSLN